jgi:DNA polymerase III epsilon subunit-like protein
MNENLLRFKKNQKYVIFDYETCNLNLSSFENKPWQLGFICCSGSNIVDKFDLTVGWDEINVSDDAAKITNFNINKYNKNKIDAKKCLDSFEKYLYDPDYIIVGHNVLGFDVYIHNIHRLLCGKESDYSYMNRVLDTNCLARAIKNDIKFDQSSCLISWQYKLLNYRKKGVKTNLKQLCKDYSIEFDDSKLHDALYDVEKTFEVLNKIIWDIEI